MMSVLCRWWEAEESAQVSDVSRLGGNGRTELLVLKLQESLLLYEQYGKHLSNPMRYSSGTVELE